MKILLIIYVICLIPTFLVYPTIKVYQPNLPNFLKFFMAWFIMPMFLMWQLYIKLFNKNKK